MSATIPPRARRRWTNLYLWALFSLAGCSSGVVEPIVAAVTADAGDRDGQVDIDAASDEGHERRGRPDCDDFGDWPETASANEYMLLGALNWLRFRPPPDLCSGMTERAWDLFSSNDLRCVARLGATQRTITDGTDGAVTFLRNLDERDIRDREERAGIRGGTVRLELLIMNAESSDEIYEQLFASPGDACRALDPTWQSVGIAQREGFWTLDFSGGGGGPPPRRP